MDVKDMIAAAATALGVTEVVPLIQGGQKIVLKASFSGVPCAVKIVPLPVGPGGVITLKRAHREVELLAAVESPFVVKVLTDAIELGSPAEAVCWVEEWLDGADLSSLLQTRWSEAEVWTLLTDSARALAACHSLDVVHRDLSSGNLRRRDDGRFVLMDPGLARHLARTAITGAFQPGTPGWRSPEHAVGGEPVPASDVFCLGLLAFYALSGEFAIDPHHGSNADYDRRLTETQAPSIASLTAGLSSDLVDIVDTCLQRQPARRFIDGTELLEAISQAQGGSL